MSKCEYKYGDYVDINNIEIYEDDGYRYSLFIPFKNTSKKDNIIEKNDVLVIMRNPSKANQNKSDKTITNVLKFCYGKYTAVYIGNIYPYYETESSKIKSFIDSDVYEVEMKKKPRSVRKFI